MISCRLIVDEPRAGPWNMAVDEALLDAAADRGVATLRFYRWEEPTLSLGYFQRVADRRSHEASRQAAIVRRLSGGGALLHDRELTYALCLPATHPLAGDSQELYATVHRAIIAAFGTWGLAARLHGDGPAAADRSDSEEQFLCFQRRSGADVVLPVSGSSSADVKIVGSAQRRRGRAVLQHGAVLLGASLAAPELVGVREAAGIQIAAGDFAGPCSEAVADALGVVLSSDPLEQPTLNLAQRLCEEKYAQAHWTDRR